MILSDQHLHTSFSGDSDAPPQMQIEKAIALGLKSICVTDHHDHDVVSDIDFELDIPEYLEKMQQLRADYRDKIDLRIGIELGLQTHISDYLKELSVKYPFDLIIGSVHFIDGLDPYYPPYFEANPTNAYERFFEATLENIKASPCFDTLGHLDYIVRYGAERGLPYSYRTFAEYIDPILAFIIEKGFALECNTGSLAKGMKEPNPCKDVLIRYKELGGELITAGSDAHSPETLGYAFEEITELLKDCGFDYLAVYKERKPEMVKL